MVPIFIYMLSLDKSDPSLATNDSVRSPTHRGFSCLSHLRRKHLSRQVLPGHVVVRESSTCSKTTIYQLGIEGSILASVLAEEALVV